MIKARPSGPGSYLLSIQYLRGLAAVAVAIDHIAGHLGLPLQVGAAGVDIFFIISGFIIWTVTAGRSISPQKFLFDRFSRVAPLYVLLTALVYLSATELPGAFPNMHTNLTHAALSAAFIPHHDPYGTLFPQVIPGWTLVYELFFYLIFTALLWIKKENRPQVCSLLLIGLVLVGTLNTSHSAALTVYTNKLLLEFVAGVWIGVAWNHGYAPRLAWGASSLAAGLILLAAWQLYYGSQPVAWRAAAWGIPSVLIVLGTLAIERHYQIKRLPALLAVGNASYSIYLVNVFVVAACWRLCGTFSSTLYAAVALFASVASGVTIWWLIERRLTLMVRSAGKTVFLSFQTSRAELPSG